MRVPWAESPLCRRLGIAVAVAALALTVPTLAADPGAAPARPFAVGFRLLRLVDRSRRIELPGGRSEFRPIVTYVRYPALGVASSSDRPGAAPDRAAGPYPLIVFGHGFAVTPATYASLLHAWASAGYVVAAPVFPLGNAHAPGGPNESDLINQPADMSFVISRLLAPGESKASPLAGLIDRRRIAVAGHSDGGDTALAVTYNRRVRDPRIRAAVIMSGAEITGLDGYRFTPGSPALFASQGTKDTLNPPFFTHAFYTVAAGPKFLLTLPGARHLAPYTWQQPQLSIIERATTAFLDHYLKHAPLARLLTAGNRPPFATLSADP